ncbi:hypothetical protein FC89_GL000274 [Liquorilactobacillus ghanensis DSM 18630]|uniref:Uncharacterized protein n=1 Tax=Liquorilactobacillus ghanensis DSM 18630 TaxID=1423750 RepID=A0A0R1VNK1_9LACO|nr:hypothetical protein [Liquorilactobacillus ghanensis]KRM06965.1 hypothetical protein FC89_GL000274 [Liquorilactobacillus ghanensis DSM 18630]
MKISNPTTHALFAGAKGAKSVTLTTLTAGDYAAGTYEAFYDSVAGTDIGEDASDHVPVPAFTVPTSPAGS